MFFKKSLVFNPIVVADVGQIQWTRVGRHDGVLETEDAKVISALTRLAEANKLGVSVITQEEFEDLKKNPYVAPSHQWSPGISREHLEALRPPIPQSEQAAVSEPAPVPAKTPRARAPKPATSKGVLPK